MRVARPHMNNIVSMQRCDRAGSTIDGDAVSGSIITGPRYLPGSRHAYVIVRKLFTQLPQQTEKMPGNIECAS